ncbi:hypothetical protein A8B82_03410 [Sulfitobacter sp. EhC04]|uniref:DUF6778 family protein n=1 Tax=Sulfitobacter sp. EhC04 TaxID=1849168 RepID=UPI0007F3C910|nr:DUF6778 family protein [Sulfitobacter sp. EhC04]OAN71361.1 hypothetical protein A8B82_03410 [Sulfitobacter sp. EhC04]
MKTLKVIAAIGLGAMVSACSSVPDIASRNAPFEATPQLAFQQVAPDAQPQMALPQSLKVSAINVRVPGNLKVSEANVYYPRADIVWRGEPIGNRHAQVQKIFEQAFLHGTRDMQGTSDVVLDVEVTRFHSVTEKTRYSVGGVHNMEFNLTVRSAATGLPLAPTRQVEANLPAFGGKQALEADRRGQTQIVRVSGYLAEVIRQELAKPSVAPAPKRKLAALTE